MLYHSCSFSPVIYTIVDRPLVFFSSSKWSAYYMAVYLLYGIDINWQLYQTLHTGATLKSVVISWAKEMVTSRIRLEIILKVRHMTDAHYEACVGKRLTSPASAYFDTHIASVARSLNALFTSPDKAYNSSNWAESTSSVVIGSMLLYMCCCTQYFRRYQSFLEFQR